MNQLSESLSQDSFIVQASNVTISRLSLSAMTLTGSKTYSKNSLISFLIALTCANIMDIQKKKLIKQAHWDLLRWGRFE